MNTKITKTSNGYEVSVYNLRGKLVAKNVYAEMPTSSVVADFAVFVYKRFGCK